MAGPVFVDMNIPVCRHDSSEIAEQPQADDWHTFLWRRRLGRLGFQVLQELYAMLTRGRGLGLDHAAGVPGDAMTRGANPTAEMRS